MTDTLRAAGPAATVLDVAGVTTTLRRAGSGAPVLFLHGAFFATRWLPLHDHLATAVDLIAPVHPGFAEGEPPDWLRGFDDLVLHYRSLLDALDLERVHLVGYDLGGWLAADLAIFHPERVRSLTLVAASGLRVPGAPMLEFLGLDPARLPDALFNGEAPPPGLFPDPTDIGQFVDAYGESSVTTRLIWERRYDTRLDRRLARVRLPALVVASADDRVVPTAHAERWIELLPDARLELVDGVGHALVVQAPERVGDLVLRFVEEHGS